MYSGLWRPAMIGGVTSFVFAAAYAMTSSAAIVPKIALRMRTPAIAAPRAMTRIASTVPLRGSEKRIEAIAPTHNPDSIPVPKKCDR